MNYGRSQKCICQITIGTNYFSCGNPLYGDAGRVGLQMDLGKVASDHGLYGLNTETFCQNKIIM